uniref:Reverse transcriptase domain-containing protein n=1 Tax=Echinostoma caproni TaxID=27848 RepID=A0A183BGZ6_9TREM
LAGYFGGVRQTDDAMPRILEIGSTPPEIEEIQLSEEIVHQHLEDLDVHEAVGPDKIHPANIKPIADTFE